MGPPHPPSGSCPHFYSDTCLITPPNPFIVADSPYYWLMVGGFARLTTPRLYFFLFSYLLGSLSCTARHIYLFPSEWRAGFLFLLFYYFAIRGGTRSGCRSAKCFAVSSFRLRVRGCRFFTHGQSPPLTRPPPSALYPDELSLFGCILLDECQFLFFAVSAAGGCVCQRLFFLLIYNFLGMHRFKKFF